MTYTCFFFFRAYISKYAKSELENIDNELSLFFQYHPALGYEGVRDIRRKFMGSTVTHNKHGLRGNFYPYIKKEAKRLVFLGDSQIWGHSVGDNHTIPHQVEKMLNRPKHDIEIQAINLGVSGYSTSQELLSYYLKGQRYDPDLVIWTIFYNDIWNNQEAFQHGVYRPYIFENKSGDLCLSSFPVKRQPFFFRNNKSLIERIDTDRTYLGGLFLREMLDDLFDNLLDRNNNFHNLETNFACQDRTEDSKINGRSVLVKSFIKLKKQLEKKQIPLLAVMIPHRTLFEKRKENLSFNKVSEVFRQNNILYINIHNIALERNVPYSNLFFNKEQHPKWDDHLSKYGTEYASKLIYEKIVGNNFLGNTDP